MLKNVPRISSPKIWCSSIKSSKSQTHVRTSGISFTSRSCISPIVPASNTIFTSVSHLHNKFSHTRHAIAIDVTVINKQPKNLFSTLATNNRNSLKISVSCNNVCHQFSTEDYSRNQRRYYHLPSTTRNLLSNLTGGRVTHLPQNWVLILLMLINILIFLLWNTYGESSRKGRRFMFDNFTASIRNLSEGRVWTLITSCLSQKDVLHLGINMFVLWSAGNALISVLGVTRFLTIYFLGGMSSSLVAMGHNMYTHRDYPTHGASGSVSSIITVWGCMFPYSQVQVLFFPLPAIGAVGLFIAWDLYHAYNGGTNISHAGHLGGNIFGFLYYFIRGPRIGL